MYHKGKQSVFVVGRLWTLLPPPAKVEALHLFRCYTHKTQQTHTHTHYATSTLHQVHFCSTLHHINYTTYTALRCTCISFHYTTLRYAAHTHTHPHTRTMASLPAGPRPEPYARMPDMSECMSDKMLDRMQEYLKKKNIKWINKVS